MTDPFHKELQKRLMSLNARKEKLQQRLIDANAELNDLNRASDGIATLLRIEGAETEVVQISVTNGAGPKLYDTVLDVLSDGHRHSVEEIVTIAQGRGVDFQEKHPYRSTSMTLLGISRGGKIENVAKGFWRQAG